MPGGSTNSSCFSSFPRKRESGGPSPSPSQRPRVVSGKRQHVGRFVQTPVLGVEGPDGLVASDQQTGLGISGNARRQQPRLYNTLEPASVNPVADRLIQGNKNVQSGTS